MSERVYIQEGVERFGGATTFDETMAGSAYLTAMILVGVLQKTGPVVLDEGWFDRAERAVVLTDAVEGKTFGDGARVYAVPRAEADVKPWEPEHAR